MSIETRIEKEIKRAGGRLNLDEVEDNYAEFLSLQLSRFRQAANFIVQQLDSIKYIDVDILDNYRFNAFAKGQNGKYFIGINRGLIATITLVFSRLFADKDFLKFVGDVNNEEDNLPLIKSLSPNFEATVDKLPPLKPPRDSVRRETARLFSWLAYDLILAHELGHIIRGHADMYESKGNFHLDENEIIKANRAFKLERKTLEMDADIWACNMLLTTELSRCLGRLGIPGEHWKWSYERPGVILLNFSFIVSTVFKIFGDTRLDYKPFSEQMYPVPRLRFIISKLRIADNSEFKEINKIGKFNTDENGVPIHVKLAFNTIEDAFKKITGKDNNEISANDARGNLGKKQLNILRNHWNNELMGKLKPFSHIKL
ncbi:MAG: hypothetical protein AAGJ18_01090, partial [Bacteroidota bacterium]